MDQIWKTENFKEASYTFGALKNEKKIAMFIFVLILVIFLLIFLKL
jgi:hypothetical protein